MVELIQGPFSRSSPRASHRNYAAYDFALPRGTPVVAVRSGKVWHIESEFPDWSEDPTRSNVILIMHSDSTVASYNHLEQGSIRVIGGEYVAAGEIIASSGESGTAGGPHLHFDVRAYVYEIETLVPVRFQTRRHPMGTTLKEGESYEAF